MHAEEHEEGQFATIPMRWVGPARLTGPVVEGEVMFPLATYETPLWPSVERGARVSGVSGGIAVVVADERMTRSVLVEARSAGEALAARDWLMSAQGEAAGGAAGTSRFARLKEIHTQVVGGLLFVRFEFSTGDAAGHNMATKAAERMLDWMLERRRELSYVSISGNYCSDKKATAVNGILGRGKYVVAEMTVPEKICRRYLKTTASAVAALNVKKNLIGTMMAGGLRSGNAHFANMLLGFYLATGQDAANVVEGSQGMVHAEARGEDLYFSCTLPNVIVGTAGNGKDLAFVRENLARLGCLEDRAPGENARRLAAICGAAVLCGELSLLAAQTNRGELMAAHERLERSGAAKRGGGA